MTLEEYIGRYRLLQRALERDERMLELMGRTEYSAFLRRFQAVESPVLAPLLTTQSGVRERIERRQRLCLRYAERIARAVARIPSPVLQQYAMCRYLYGMTHEDIAEQSFFCVRTVYRHATQARRELNRALLAVMPKVRRTKAARFHTKRPLPRRSYAMTQAEKSTARCRGKENFALRRQLRFAN